IHGRDLIVLRQGLEVLLVGRRKRFVIGQGSTARVRARRRQHDCNHPETDKNKTSDTISKHDHSSRNAELPIRKFVGCRVTNVRNGSNYGTLACSAAALVSSSQLSGPSIASAVSSPLR